MINLKNKSIVVTGGTKGIGVEITKSFLKQNSRVFVLARQKPKRIIQAKGNKAIFIECDIRKIESLDNAVKEIKTSSKSIDVLINNVGGAPMADALNVSNKFHEAVIDLNLIAPLNVSQKFAKIIENIKLHNKDNFLISDNYYSYGFGKRKKRKSICFYGTSKKGIKIVNTDLILSNIIA